ncbi:hypothetical protein OAQ85_03190 [Schleiferiaceae bacterium]|nr:hypothetical protein [Schleiferiaceae bacterium]
MNNGPRNTQRIDSFVTMNILFKTAIVCILLPLISPQVKAQSKTDSSAVKEIVVFTTRGINASGARYHVDKCRYLKNGQIHIDERIALQRGLLPCSVCLPERTSDLSHLRQKKVVPKKNVYRKCGFKTNSGAKCRRKALDDSRYCELHYSRERKKK